MTLLGPGEGETIHFGPTRAEMKAVRDTAGGAFSMSDTTIAPGFPGPPPHLHEELYDAFYVLEGTLTLRLGDEEIEAAVGTFACVPPGVVHTFSNPGDQPVRFININSPGGWEAYLRDLVRAMPEQGPPDPEAMREIASRHDVTFVSA